MTTENLGLYADNLKKYFELCQTELDENLTENEYIDKLVEIANKKREIQLANNAFIAAHIAPYDKPESELDEEAFTSVRTIFDSLHDGAEYYDHSMSLRIARILRRGYTVREMWPYVMHTEYLLMYFSMIGTDHTAYKEPIECIDRMEINLQHIDKNEETSLGNFFNFAFASVYNPMDRRGAVARFSKVEALARELFPQIFEAERPYHAAVQYALIDTLSQSYVSFIEDRNTFSEEEKVQLRACLEMLRKDVEQKKIVLQEEAAKIIVITSDFMLGNCDYDTMQSRLMQLFEAKKEEARLDSFYQLFNVSDEYVSNIWAFSNKSQEEKVRETEDIFRRVLRGYESFEKGRDITRLLLGLAQLVKNCANNLGFSRMNEQVLKMTVYADKALYIHTLMVKRIAMIILEAVLEDNPAYLDGVAGYEAKFVAKHPRVIMDLMAQCALFHDIGKFFCLEYVGNSSRNLTDDEFRAIQYHPENFDEFFKDEEDDEFACIRDCARLHHLWYNGQGGYPRKLSHTNNQPFVNILSIADSLDAATDVIGRPYTSGKTLDMLIEEFDSFRDTRYCGYITDVIKKPEVKSRIDYAIHTERRHINYEIMTKK